MVSGVTKVKWRIRQILHFVEFARKFSRTHRERNKKMLVKIRRGIGRPGKLWTGDEPANEEIVNARIVERRCECGASTRKLRVEKVENASAIAEACEVPTLFVTMGGVGSLCSYSLHEDGEKIDVFPEYQCWNWSGRVGGHIFLNPAAVLNGYWEENDLPKPRADHYWVRTYSGSTLSEFVLLCRSTNHDLPTVSLSGTCPRCREKRERESIPEDLMVQREELALAINGEDRLPRYEEELGLQEGTKEFPARGLHRLAWERRDDRIKAAIEAAKDRLLREKKSETSDTSSHAM